MHDCKGREIHKNDIVMTDDKHWLGRTLYRAVALAPSSESCNLTGVPIEHAGSHVQTLTAKEVEIVLKNNGEKPE